MFLLAARHDALVTPMQLFALEHLVGTPPHEIRKWTADCRHLGLFMGKRILREMWPDIVDWLVKPGMLRARAMHRVAAEQASGGLVWGLSGRVVTAGRCL